MENLRVELLSITFLLLITACNSGEKSSQKMEEKISSNNIRLSDAWARPGSKDGNSAAYLRIFNGTNITDTLIRVSTQAAKKAEVHESYEENGMSGMRPAGRQAIKPNSAFKLQPGGFHIMLMRLNKSLAKGDSLQLLLQFAKAGARRIIVPVQATQNSNPSQQ